MKLYIRRLEDNDYDNILLTWWKAWGWEAPPKDFLPNDGVGGFIVYDNDIPVCAGFVWPCGPTVN
jgi:hypothetical protein